VPGAGDRASHPELRERAGGPGLRERVEAQGCVRWQEAQVGEARNVAERAGGWL